MAPRSGGDASDEQLKNLVIERALGDPALSEEAQLVVLAALESDEDLDQVLADGATPKEIVERVSTPTVTAVEPKGTFLRSITVQRFRGIGDQVRVDLPTKPGLVVVAGRNGSGKSSLAEALEIALTGINSRWQSKLKNDVWSAQWRNLHAGAAPEVRVGITEEGEGVTTVGVDWPSAPETPVTACTRWAQRPSVKKEPIAGLGWERALELYRPLLSYDELGSILEGSPKDFYDQLFRLLGLEQLTEGAARLDAAVKRLKEPAAAMAEAKKNAKAALDAIDPRDSCAASRHASAIAVSTRPYPLPAPLPEENDEPFQTSGPAHLRHARNCCHRLCVP